MKQLLSSILSLSLLAATSAQTTIAYADNGTHTCSCISASAAEAPGKIISLAGDVLQSGKSGYTLASEGADVSVGSLLSVGAKSAAKVSFGSSCSILVPANSELKVSLTDNVAAPICASITSTGQTEAAVKTFDTTEAKYGADLPEAVSDSVLAPVTEAVPGGFSLSPTTLLLGALVAGGIGYGIFELVDDDDDDDAAGSDAATPTS